METPLIQNPSPEISSSYITASDRFRGNLWLGRETILTAGQQLSYQGITLVCSFVAMALM